MRAISTWVLEGVPFIAMFLTLPPSALCDNTWKKVMAYDNHGIDKLTKGDLDGAIANFTKAIQLRPNDATAYGKRGLAKALKGDMDGAIADFAKLASISPAEAASTLADAAKLGRLKVVQAMVAAKVVDIDGEQQSGPKERPVLGPLGLLNFWAGATGPSPPLIAAARAGNLEMVKWLVEHGASLDLQEKANVLKDLQQVNGVTVFRPVQVMGAGNTALSAAVLAGQTAVVQFLIERGADVSRRVVFRSAAIPGIEAFGGSTMGFLFTHQGDSLHQGADGVISTNTTISPEQALSIRELMANSSVPEIKAQQQTISH
jgi:hypothetical protein